MTQYEVAQQLTFAAGHKLNMLYVHDAREALKTIANVDPIPTATAGNNSFLRASKAQWNHKIYNNVLWLVKTYGEPAGRIYLSQYHTGVLGY